MKNIILCFILSFFIISSLFGADMREGLEQYKNKSYKKAKEIFLEIIKIDLKNYNAYLYLGKTSMILGDYDNAILALQRAIALQPSKVDSYIDLAEIYLNTEHYDLAEKYCSYAMENDKTEYDRCYYILGLIYFNKNDFDKAKRLFKKACELNPENALYYNYTGLVYLKLNEFNKANTSFLMATALDNNTYFFYFNLGLSYENLGEWPKAIESYNKSLKLRSNYTNAKIQLKKAVIMQKIDEQKKKEEKKKQKR